MIGIRLLCILATVVASFVIGEQYVTVRDVTRQVHNLDPTASQSALPDMVKIEITPEEGDSFSLALERSREWDNNAPVHTRSAANQNLEQTERKELYRDLISGSIFHVGTVGDKQHLDKQRTLTGNLKHNGKNYHIHPIKSPVQQVANLLTKRHHDNRVTPILHVMEESSANEKRDHTDSLPDIFEGSTTQGSWLFSYCDYDVIEGYWITCPNHPDVCIPVWWFGDQWIDCPDAADEKRQYTRHLPSGFLNHVRCPRQEDELIEDSKMCDGYRDCGPEGRDESEYYCDRVIPYCDAFYNFSMNCPNNPKTCIPLDWLCDELNDCGDGSEATDEDPYLCRLFTPYAFGNPCADQDYLYECYFSNLGRECIWSHEICDGEADCYAPPGETANDENDCAFEYDYYYRECDEDQFKCEGNSWDCFPNSYRCDGILDCAEAEDERDCEDGREIDTGSFRDAQIVLNDKQKVLRQLKKKKQHGVYRGSNLL